MFATSLISRWLDAILARFTGLAEASQDPPHHMPRVILTGGPGVGKSSLLKSLAGLGYTIVEESARAVIRERKAAGLQPRPEPAAFAAEVLSRDLEKYRSTQDGADWIFFDRSPLEAATMLLEAQGIEESEYHALVAGLRFHTAVLLLPPWPEIYVQDDERDHTFEHCVRVHHSLVRLYTGQGFQLLEVPCGPVELRAAAVLRMLANRRT